MDQEQIHILITGEQGEGRSFAVPGKTARRTVIIILGILLFLIISSIAGITFFTRNLILSSKNQALRAQLQETMSVLDDMQANRYSLISSYQDDIARLQKDRENLLEETITRLDEKSKIIEQVINHIGVEVKVDEDPNHSGGPFTSKDEQYGKRLILKADRYLEVLERIPLGRPVPGEISSKYGGRIDPLIKRKAFHTGVDFRGKTGDEVLATASAKVKTSSYNSDFGNHIVLSHGNGYETIFAHLQKRLVKKGEKVQRGQVIGLIGNTGRSTGSHLHYGINYKKKSIDPTKYLQVAELSVNVTKQ